MDKKTRNLCTKPLKITVYIVLLIAAITTNRDFIINNYNKFITPSCPKIEADIKRYNWPIVNINVVAREGTKRSYIDSLGKKVRIGSTDTILLGLADNEYIFGVAEKNAEELCAIAHTLRKDAAIKHVNVVIRELKRSFPL